jgi:murein DD-endopeptidase / murein LD-carboxypeptidase
MKKKVCFAFIFICFLTGPGAEAKQTPTIRNQASIPRQSPFSEKNIQKKMKEFIGIPYVLGGINQRGMDCSGLVKHLYSLFFKIDLPHQSSQQHALPIFDTIDPKELRPGDLIFFSPRKNRVNHVGIYYGDGKFLHAATKKGVLLSKLSDNYWKSRVVSTKRLKRSALTHLVVAERRDGFEIRYGEKDSLRFETATLVENRLRHADIGLLPFTDPESLNSSFELSHFPDFQIEYQHGSAREALGFKVSALRERLASYGSLELEPLYPLNWRAWATALEPAATYVKKGMRVSGDITPSKWLRISSSVTYFDTPEEARFDPSHLAYGIEARVAPFSPRWSLAMSLQYSDLPDDYVARNLGWNTLDMSVAIGYQFSNSLQFSILSQRGRFETDQSLRGFGDLMFTVDFSY